MIRKSLLHKRRDHPLHIFLMSTAFCVSMIFVFLVFGVYANIEAFFVGQQRGEIDRSRFDMVRRNDGTVGLFRRQEISADVLRDFQTDSRITSLYKIYRVHLPAVLKVDIGGSLIESDIFLYAVDDAFWAEQHDIDLADAKQTNTIPLAASQLLLDTYNTQVAGADGFVPIPSITVSRVPLQIEFGQSYVVASPRDHQIERDARIMMLDNALPLIGVTIPYSIAMEMAGEYDDVDVIVHSVLGYVEEPRMIEQLKDEYPSYYIRSDSDILAIVRKQLIGVRIFMALIGAFVGSMLIFFLLYVLQTSRRQNRQLFFIYRIHGARRRVLWSLVVGEVLLYIIGGTCIVLALWAALRGLQPWLTEVLFASRGLAFALVIPTWGQTLQIIGAHLVLLLVASALMQWGLIMRRFE